MTDCICKYYGLCSIVAWGDDQTFSSLCKIQIFDFLSDLMLNCFDDYIFVHDTQNIRDQVWVSESVCDEVFEDEDENDGEKDGMQR